MSKAAPDTTKPADKAVQTTEAASTSVQATNYDNIVKATVALVDRFMESTLTFYWNLGEKVDSLASQPGKYGNASVEKFASDLLKHGKTTLKVDALYDARQVYRNMTPAQLKLAQASNLSLRGVLKLCTKNITPERREEILQTAANTPPGETVTSADIQELLDTPSTKGEGGGSRQLSSRKAGGKSSDDMNLGQAIRITKGANQMFSSVTEKIRHYAEAVKMVTQCDDMDKIQNAAKNHAEAMDAMVELFDKWTRECERASAHLEKALPSDDKKSGKK